MRSIRSVREVAAQQLCLGCGACASLHPNAIEMIDVLDEGRRPRQRVGVTVNGELQDALRVCPGIGLAHDDEAISPGVIEDLRAGWGPVLEIWEGYAADPEIRYAGSSGGAATALALYCLERRGMHGVLHTAARDDVPYLNHTVLSQSREELLARTGSRYAPSSPCDALREIEDAAKPCVFIGKPCDVAATLKMRRIRPELDRKLGLTIAFFCAGTPSTNGTLDLLKEVGVEDPSRVKSIRYRGNGWPGMWTVDFENESGELETRRMSYEKSWAFLERYRQWRCYICPDHTGEFADVAVGDPWYRSIEPGEHGSSLILARTTRGREVVEHAIETGFLTAGKVRPQLLPDSQRGLLKTRGRLWGQMLALLLLGSTRPRYKGFCMFRFWWSELTMAKKAKSVLGTVKVVLARRRNRRNESGLSDRISPRSVV